MDIQKYLVLNNVSIRQALFALNNLSDTTMTLFVVNTDNQMQGTITDGDIRRYLLSGGSLEDLISSAMNENFSYLESDKVDLLQIKALKKRNIFLIPRLDSRKSIVGFYNLKSKQSILPIDAVLMAGGKGERLRPLTQNVPKPLLPVGNKAIIDYNVDRLLSYGVEHISVTVNYLKEQIEKHFDTIREGIKINCIREPQYLGTIGSVKFIESFYNDTVLVMNSDIFTNLNYEDFFIDFVENDADISIAVVPYNVSIPYGIFELDGINITKIKEKPSYEFYVNAGIYLIKKELLKMIPDNVFYNATDLIESLIALQKRVIKFQITGYWIDIGKHSEYDKAKELVKHIDF